MKGRIENDGEVRARIVADIRQLAAERGGPPGQVLFGRLSGWPRRSWYGKYWSRWSDALKEAGFPPNTTKPRLDDELMLEKYAELARDLKRLPTSVDLSLCAHNGGDVPAYRTYVDHFGHRRELLARLKK